MLCGELALIGRDEQSVLISPLRCKCWHCEYCAPRLQARLIAIAIAGEPTTLLTLTTNPQTEPDPDRAAERLLRAWQKLSRIYRRRYQAHTWAYLGIWEKTQRGMPHLHILLRAPWIDQHEISAFMNAEIGAPIVDIRRVDNTKMVARYVAKYTAKEPAKFEGRTRFARSRNWLETATQRQYLKNLRDTYGWHLTHQTIAAWLAILDPLFQIQDDGDGYRCTPRAHEMPQPFILNRGSP